VAVWSKGGLSGFDGQRVELCGRMMVRRAGQLLFDDGVRRRWLPCEHLIRWQRVQGSYHIITIPAWLAKRQGLTLKRKRKFAKWSSGAPRARY